jgi:hypothetical protein
MSTDREQLARKVIAYARMNKSAGFNGYDRQPEQGSIYEIALEIMNCQNDEQLPALSPPQAVDEKGIREAAEAYANNCLDITTTTWEWIVDAYEAGASRSVKGGNNQNES